ncbi:3-hydroxyisobutyryl-CoA hydrolase [Dispira simplex]|nr:3-hydroxyisobutyryl-CoA hydrolase [Dispira simplex]
MLGLAPVRCLTRSVVATHRNLLGMSNPIRSTVLRTQQIASHFHTSRMHSQRPSTPTLGCDPSKTMAERTPTFNQPQSQTEVIQHKHEYGRVFILNRPKALNALTLDMVRSMTPQLLAWEKSDLCNVIILKSSSERAFCAGGDVKKVVEGVQAQDKNFATFFQEEYVLNDLLGSVNTPIVALIDGITMGGGVGLSVHAPFRVATERTLFAMPETAIGLFPDVGGSHFLPRLDGALGKYLGLTGRQLKGKSVFWAGVATHYVPSERLPALEQRLCELPTSDLEAVNNAIEEFSEEAAKLADPSEFSLYPYLGAIDRCFRYSTVSEIVTALKRELDNPTQHSPLLTAGELTGWVRETLSTLRGMSPTSLVVTNTLLNDGASLSLKKCLQREFQVVQKLAQSHDFVEGVTAKLVRRSKEPTQWNPASLEEVDERTIASLYFGGNGRSLQFLSETDQSTPTNPQNFALVTENEVRKLLASSGLKVTVPELSQYFNLKYQNKIGVDTKLRIILDTKFVVDPQSQLISEPKE